MKLKVRLEGMTSFDGWLLLGEATQEEFIVVAGLPNVMQARWGGCLISAPTIVGTPYHLWIGGTCYIEEDLVTLAGLIRANL